MTENLNALIKQEAGDAIINNPAIPNEKNDLAIHETSNALMGSLQGAMTGGGLAGLLKMFGSNGSDIPSSPVTQQATGNVVSALVNKLGLDPGIAGGIAGNIIPNILRKLVTKTNDPGDSSFNLQDIFNHLSNGKTQSVNIPSMAQKASKGGFDKDGDGDTDLQDLMAMFSGGKGQSGGLAGGLDALKGMLGSK